MARNRNGRYDASYRDRYGAVKWTKTFPTAKAADAAAHAARALEVSGVDAKAVLKKDAQPRNWDFRAARTATRSSPLITILS